MFGFVYAVYNKAILRPCQASLLEFFLRKYIIVNVQNVWDKVFKNEPSKLCGRQLLKNLKWYGLLKQTSRPFCFKFFKGCLPQILLKCQQRFLTGFKIRLCTQPAFTCSKLTIENTKTRYEICSTLTIKTPERR